MSFHYFYLFTRNFWNALTVSQLASVCIFQIISHLNLEKNHCKNQHIFKKKKKSWELHFKESEGDKYYSLLQTLPAGQFVFLFCELTCKDFKD